MSESLSTACLLLRGRLRREFSEHLLHVRIKFLRVRFRITRKVPARSSSPDQISGMVIEQAYNERANLVIVDEESRISDSSPAAAPEAVISRVILPMNCNFLDSHESDVSAGRHLDPSLLGQLLIDGGLDARVPDRVGGVNFGPRICPDPGEVSRVIVVSCDMIGIGGDNYCRTEHGYREYIPYLHFSLSFE